MITADQIIAHEIGDYLVQRFELPMSREPSPVVPLVLD